MKLLLIGFNTRSLAESSAAGGYSFVSLDCFGDVDHSLLGPVFSPRRQHPDFPPVDRVNIECLVDWGIILAKREHCDSIVYSSGLENHPELLGKLVTESGCRLFGNTPSVLRQVRDPVALCHSLQEAGFHAPETHLADGKQPDKEKRWLVKPMKSGGGNGVALAGKRIAIPKKSVYQEYLKGKPCSFTFISDGMSNSLVLGITEQQIRGKSYTGRDFGYAGNLFPLETSGQRTLLETVANIASFLTVRYGLRGLNGVDFILHEGECWVIEVNPRYSASVELFELAYGFSMIKLHLLACDGDWHEVKRVVAQMPIELMSCRPQRIWAKAVIYTRTSKVVQPTHYTPTGEQTLAWARDLHARGLRDLPYPGEIIPAKKPVATAIASGTTRADSLKQVSKLSALMRSQLSPTR